MFEPKPGNFSLFRNEKKSEPNHPDYQLKIIFDQDLINNLQSQLDAGKTPTLYGGAWVRQRDGSSAFISGGAKPPYEQQPASPEAVDDMLKQTPIKNMEPGPLENDDPVERHEFEDRTSDTSDLPF